MDILGLKNRNQEDTLNNGKLSHEQNLKDFGFSDVQLS